MMSFIVPSLIFAAIVAALLFAPLEALPPTGRAEADGVYQSAQLYWREVAQARDWDGLKAQLRRWRQLANPGWDEAQVEEIAHALNAAVFRFAEPGSARS